MKLTYRLVALAALHPAIAVIAMSARSVASSGMGDQITEGWKIDALTIAKAPTTLADRSDAPTPA
jgi:hypothetical protein